MGSSKFKSRYLQVESGDQREDSQEKTHITDNYTETDMQRKYVPKSEAHLGLPEYKSEDNSPPESPNLGMFTFQGKAL